MHSFLAKSFAMPSSNCATRAAALNYRTCMFKEHAELNMLFIRIARYYLAIIIDITRNKIK